MTALEDAVTLEVAGPIVEYSPPVGPAYESDQHIPKPIVALIPKSNLMMIRVCGMCFFTIQPARHLVKKPTRPPCGNIDLQSVNPSHCERTLIRMVKQIRPPWHAELRILLVVKPVLVEDRHRQFVAHRLELLVEEPI